MSKDEIVECIQEWMQLPDSIEDLAKIYATIISEVKLVNDSVGVVELTKPNKADGFVLVELKVIVE